MERIIDGPLEAKSDAVKTNHIFMWAGGQAETLIDARTSEDPDLDISTPKALLDTLGSCITHSTYFREAREEFYNIRQNTDENTTAYYARLMDIYRQAEFPEDTNFLIVDKLIHSCTNQESKRKLMARDKTVTVKQCLDQLRADEAVDVTMKRMGESRIGAAYARDPTKHSQKNGSRKPKK